MTRLLVSAVMLAPWIALADCDPATPALRQFISKNPTALAKVAVSNGDLQFLGVRGYSVMVPGVDSQKCSADRGRVRVIDGTSDFSCDPKVQGAANAFAQRYNVIIKAELDAQRIGYATCAP